MNKLPKYIFSFDAEADGLVGDLFAIGVVVIDWNGNTIDQFSGSAEIETVQNTWVKENVLNNIFTLPKYNSRKEMRDAFWGFWMKYKNDCLPLADVGVPVEGHLILKTIQDNIAEREFKGPFPLFDVSAFLLTCGLDPIKIQRKEFANRADLVEHNPVDDALASALTVIRLQKEFGLFVSKNS